MFGINPDNSLITSESDVWRHFRNGHTEAFETLYRNYLKVLTNYGSRLTTDSQLLEDAIHDVFIDLWRRKEHLSDVDNVKYYLFKALRNKLIRNGKGNIFENSEDIDKFLDYLVSLSLEEQSIDSETLLSKTQHVQNAIAKLSDRQKEVINLRFYHGLNLDEISGLMDLSKQCVSNLLYKSYAVLRLRLKDLSILSVVINLLNQSADMEISAWL